MAQKQPHPIWKYRDTVTKKLAFKLAQNDENQFLKWIWKQCFLGTYNNSKAIEIKKTVGHILEGVCSFI